MKRKVVITKLPKAQSGLEVKQGLNSRVAPWFSSGSMSAPSISVNKTIKAVPRDQANIEAEKGEVAMLPTKSGIPDTYRIGGQRHHSGGTPLSVPPKTFIYSDTKDMRIKDKEMLKQFGMGGDGPYTPADIAKKYDVNKFKKILLDPDTDKIMRDTAEKMIANYNLKLGKLALLQESMKGFPQGVPEVAIAYMESMKINPAEFIQGPEAGEDAQEPQARYGGNIMKYGGRDDSNKRVIVNLPKTKRVIVNLPKAQVGKEVTESPKSYEKSFASVVKTVSDPDVQKAIYENYLKEAEKIKDPKVRATALAAPIDKVIKNLIQMQKQNYAIHSAGIDLSDVEGVWDNPNASDKNKKKWAKNEKYKATMAELGFKPEEIIGTDEDIAIAQAAYNSTLTVSGSDKYKDKFANFEPLKGKGDEKYDPSRPNLSAPDTWYGNTTAGQLLKYVEPKEEKQPETPAAEPEDTTDTTDPNGPVKADNFQQPNIDFGAPWWLQDVIKTGHAAGNLMRIKKYAPWQAKANVVTPDVTFYDPTRELAANAEQSNIAAQNLAQFTGPQAFNARFSETQGNAARNAADILGRYNNLNVGVSNQQSAANANIMNQAGQNAANAATSLWDKYQIMNQQFDNSKSQARDALVNQYTSGITNKEYTANLNQMYPQFAVDPSRGGRMYFKNPRDLNPDYSKDKEFRDIYDDLLTHPNLKNNPDKAADITLKLMGKYGTDNSFDAYTAYTQQKKGVDPRYVPNNYPG